VLTLVYKRTHNGDPDPDSGEFGIYDCMGSVRAWPYDSVVGVGGIGDEPRRHGIAEKINWIGIGPVRRVGRGKGPIVAFEHFLYFGAEGPRVIEYVPTLAAHMYGLNVRMLMRFTPAEETEVGAILRLAQYAPPSRVLSRSERRSSPRNRRQIDSGDRPIPTSRSDPARPRRRC
jgi:hypothetical protein